MADKNHSCVICKCFTCAENRAINPKYNKEYPNRCIGCSYCYMNQCFSVTGNCQTYKRKGEK